MGRAQALPSGLGSNSGIPAYLHCHLRQVPSLFNLSRHLQNGNGSVYLSRLCEGVWPIESVFSGVACLPTVVTVVIIIYFAYCILS